MRLRRQIRLPTLIAALLLAALAMRFVWTVSQTDTGWETVSDDWHSAFIGQFFGYGAANPHGTAVEQDKFWLPEIRRVLRREKPTPELMLGVVAFLHTYGVKIPPPDQAAVPGLADGKARPRDLPFDAILETNRKRRAVQLKLAAEATSLFPNSRCVWQTRAALNSEFYNPEMESADSKWRAVLEECKSHDPSNSLYDYLFANRLLQEALELETAAERDADLGKPQSDEAAAERNQKVADFENEAVEHIRRALDMPHFETPEFRKSVIGFIDETSLSPQEKAQTLTWATDFRLPAPSGMSAVLSELAEKRDSRSDVGAGKDLHQLAVQLLEVDTPRLKSSISQLRHDRYLADQWTSWLQYLNRSLKPVPEAVDAKQKAIECEIRARLEWEAFLGWNRQNAPPAQYSWVGFAGWKAAHLTVLLLLAAVVGYAVCLVIRRSSLQTEATQFKQIGFGWRAAAWLVALAGSVAVLGLAPAEIISHEVQAWFALAIFLVAMVALPVAIAIASGGRFSLRTLMGLVVVYALIFAGLIFWNAIQGDRPLNKLPPEVWVPAHSLNVALPSTGAPSYVAAVQWVLYHGPEWTLTAALGLIALFALVFSEQERRTKQLSDLPRWWSIVAALNALSRSAAGVAVLALAVYLALAPRRVYDIEQYYQYEVLVVRDPDTFWKSFEETKSELAKNGQYLQKLRNQVEADLSAP
jgi:hypothetical protein